MKRTFIVALAILFGGCVDYTEELWFNSDLSGRIKVGITIEEKLVKLSEDAGRGDNIFTEEGIYGRFDRIKGVRIIDAKVYTDGESRLSTFTLAFDSLESLKKISNVGKETDFLGEISVTENDNRTFTFARTVVMSNDARNNMIDRLMNQYTWIYKVHFPGKVLEADETLNSFDREKGSVTWVYSLKDLTKSPRTMKVIYATPAPFDYRALIFAGIVFMVMFGGLYAFLRKNIK